MALPPFCFPAYAGDTGSVRVPVPVASVACRTVTGADTARDGSASNVNHTRPGTHQRVTTPVRGMPLAAAAAMVSSLFDPVSADGLVESLGDQRRRHRARHAPRDAAPPERGDRELIHHEDLVRSQPHEALDAGMDHQGQASVRHRLTIDQREEEKVLWPAPLGKDRRASFAG